ncbi:MAG: nitrogenase iron-molybdenum cofactor biosynthesis protein NifE [Coriobacteriales bacterium]|jgi:nitrogenase molybdenum-cofactor synthesis protein NifE|nr:nitrogenase iron-molybdenum cofactor biosynthesis protein NifE [Coriobacteriales bacterium]
MPAVILKERQASITRGGAGSGAGSGAGGGGCGLGGAAGTGQGQPSGAGIACEQASVAGSVSQRACVFCGARVVLNPITDAFHIVHGPIGCASYTWDIRGSMSSSGELYRHSFSTDMGETDVVFGGERKLARAIDEAVAAHHPPLIFVYATCIAGVIGDDVAAVCKAAEQRHQIRCIPVQAPGFSGHKAIGYRLAGDALMRLFGGQACPREKAHGINFLGDFNLAGEQWIIRNYLKELGIEVLTGITGDSRYETLMRAPQAALNIVQCAGSMHNLARRMHDELGIPWISVSFYGVEDTADSLLRLAEAYGGAQAAARARALCHRERERLAPVLKRYRRRLGGRRAAIYVGGGFKAISLIRQFRELGMETVMVGTQTGRPEDYEVIRSIVSPDCVVLDDANPAELERFMIEGGADILVGGVKERPLAYKLGVAFCDHNHERKHPLAGFVGVQNFAEEINASMNSPVWSYV